MFYISLLNTWSSGRIPILGNCCPDLGYKSICRAKNRVSFLTYLSRLNNTLQPISIFSLLLFLTSFANNFRKSFKFKVWRLLQSQFPNNCIHIKNWMVLVVLFDSQYFKSVVTVCNSDEDECELGSSHCNC